MKRETAVVLPRRFFRWSAIMDLRQAPLANEQFQHVAVTPATVVAFLEGPAAASDGRVFFSDIVNNRIMRFDPKANEGSVWRTPSGRSNGLLFDMQGRLLACEGNEFGPNDGNRRITRTDLSSGKAFSSSCTNNGGMFLPHQTTEFSSYSARHIHQGKLTSRAVRCRHSCLFL